MIATEILCIDSDPGIRKLLQRGLGRGGYQVIVGSSRAEAMNLIEQCAPDLLIVEYNPEWSLDTLDLCRTIRQRSMMPIIVTSHCTDKSAEIAALDAGADDFILKPFDLQSLEARMRAVLRRVAIEETGTANGEIQINGLIINPAKHRVTVYGQDLHLTPTEYELLRVLATHAGKVLTYQALSDEMWPGKAAKSEHYFRVYINGLRKKLDDSAAASARYIITEPGIGYRFTES